MVLGVQITVTVMHINLRYLYVNFRKREMIMLGGTPLPRRFLGPLSPALNLIDAPATRSETTGCLASVLGFDG